MERQELIAKINEAFDDYWENHHLNDEYIFDFAFRMIKQQLEISANNGLKSIRFRRENPVVNFAGLQLTYDTSLSVKLRDKLVEEGFTVAEIGHDYQITWR